MVEGDSYGHYPFGDGCFVVVGVCDGASLGDGFGVDAVVSCGWDEDGFERIGGGSHFFGEVGADEDVCAAEGFGVGFVVGEFGSDPLDGFGYGEWVGVGVLVAAGVYENIVVWGAWGEPSP